MGDELRAARPAGRRAHRERPADRAAARWSAAPAVARLAALALPGLHLADADAVHPLLARLGAVIADPATVLEHPALAEAVERSVDDADAGLDPGRSRRRCWSWSPGGTVRPGFGALALPDESGPPGARRRAYAARRRAAPAARPGHRARTARRRVGRAGAAGAVLAVGVVDGFAVLVDEEPVAPDHELDDEERWSGTSSMSRRAGSSPCGTSTSSPTTPGPPRWRCWRRAATRAALDHARRVHGLVALPARRGWAVAGPPTGGCRPPVTWPRSTTRHRPPRLSAGGSDEAVLAAIGVRADLRITDTPSCARPTCSPGSSTPARHPDVATSSPRPTPSWPRPSPTAGDNQRPGAARAGAGLSTARWPTSTSRWCSTCRGSPRSCRPGSW